MKMPFYRRLFGYYRVWVEEKSLTRLQNLIFTQRIVAYEAENGAFCIPWYQKKRLLFTAKKEHLSVSCSQIWGGPAFLRRHKTRVGIPLGILLATILLVLGTHTVWRVEISGNTAVSDALIENGLRELGFGVGSPTGTESYDDLIASFRVSNPEIAWMSVYTVGTTAYVRVIENASVEEPLPSPDLPSHLVAGEDAVVLQTEIRHGTVQVQRGEVVKKGDVLVLGWMKGAYHDRILAAEGEVLGRVRESFEVEIPYEQIEKKEIGRQKTKISLIFFEKRLNIFKKTSKSASDYVIIKKDKVFSLPGGRQLPFGFSYEEAISYKESMAVVDPETACLLGKAEIESQIREAVGEGEMLYRRVIAEEKESSCVLYATVEYTKNIAVRQPFVLE